MSIPNNKYTQSRAQRTGVPVEATTTTATVDNNDTLLNLQSWYEKNKKRINTVATVVLIGLAAIIGWRFLTAGKEEKAATQMSFAQRYFEMDSLQKALNGDGQHAGFKTVIKKYGGTKAGNLSKYYAGVISLRTGDFKSAVKYIDDFNGKGTILERAAAGALGDAHMELGATKKGIEAYEEAISDKEDEIMTPTYLQRLGMAYEMNKQPEKAKEAYKRIRDEYPTSAPARDIDRYLARLGVVE
jgi:predicted negative regulator of RcsB-dependent stress response